MGKLQINLNFCQPHLRSRTPPEKPFMKFVKRAADIVFSMISLFIVARFAAAAIAIKREEAARQFTSKSG